MSTEITSLFEKSADSNLSKGRRWTKTERRVWKETKSYS